MRYVLVLLILVVSFFGWSLAFGQVGCSQRGDCREVSLVLMLVLYAALIVLMPFSIRQFQRKAAEKHKKREEST